MFGQIAEMGQFENFSALCILTKKKNLSHIKHLTKCSMETLFLNQHDIQLKSSISVSHFPKVIDLHYFFRATSPSYNQLQQSFLFVFPSSWRVSISSPSTSSVLTPRLTMLPKGNKSYTLLTSFVSDSLTIAINTNNGHSLIFQEWLPLWDFN